MFKSSLFTLHRRTVALAFLASVLAISSAYAVTAATSIGTDISTGGNLTVSGWVQAPNFKDGSGNPMLGFTAVGADSSFYLQNNTLGNNPVLGVTATNANQGMTMMLRGDTSFGIQSSDGALDGLNIKPSHSSSVTHSSGNIMMKDDLTADREWYFQNTAGVIALGTVGNDLFFTTAANTALTLPASGTLATLAGTETFTNKTLTSPVIATGDGIYTSSGASAPAFGIYGMPGNVNYIEVGSGASGGPPGFAVKTTGADVNVSLVVGVMGTGDVVVASTALNSDRLAIAPAVGGGATFTGRLTSDDLSAARTWTLPDVDGTLSLVGHTHAGYAASGANTDITSLSGANQIDFGGNLFIGTGAVAATQQLTLGRSGFVTNLNGAGLFFSDDQANRIISVATNNANPAEKLVIRGQYGDGVTTDGGLVQIMGGHNGGAGTGAAGYIYLGDGSSPSVNTVTPGPDDVYVEGRLEVDSTVEFDSDLTANSNIFANGQLFLGPSTADPGQLYLTATDSSASSDIYRGQRVYVTDNGAVTVGADETSGIDVRVDRSGEVSGSQFAYGLKSLATFDVLSALADENAYGIYSETSGGDQSIAVGANANGNNVAVAAYGVKAEAGNAPDAYGGYFNTTGAGTTNYAVYGNAQNATTNWAGYFANGDVYVNGKVGIGDATPAATLTVGSGDKFQVDGATGNVSTAGTLTVNGGVISGFLTVSSVLNFPNVVANTCNEMTLGVVGAVAGNTAALAVPAAFESGLIAMVNINAADLATIRVCNVTIADIDPAAGTFRVDVWKH